jgi:hypothetical protein
MPINPLYDPLSEQMMPAQRFLNRNDVGQQPQPTDPFVMGLLQRAMAPQADWRMQATEQPAPSASPYIPSGLSDADIGAVRRAQRPEQRILGSLGSQSSMAPNGPLPEVPATRPYETPRPNIQGFAGMGDWNEVPMIGAQNPVEDWQQADWQQEEPQPAPVEAPAPAQQAPMAQPPAPAPQPQQPQLPPQFEQTTLAKRATGAGWDPRRLYAALAQFSGEFGNLRGKPTPSGAPAYYEQMIGEEQKQRENDLKLEEMERRYAPKPPNPIDALKMEMIIAQRDALKDKTKVNQELNDPKSPRSIAAQQAWQRLMQFQSKDKNIQVDPNVPAADIFRWIAPTQLGIQQVQAPGMVQQKQDFAAAEAEKNRAAAAAKQKASADAALALEAARQGGRKELVEAKKTGGDGAQIAPPGWRQTQKVALRPKEEESVRSLPTDADLIINQAKELIGLIKKNGSYENPRISVDGAKMASLSTALQLKEKGPEFSALGVLTGPDLELLQRMIPDTTDPVNALQKDQAVAKLEAYIQRLEDKIKARMGSWGFEREGTAQAPTSKKPIKSIKDLMGQ